MDKYKYEYLIPKTFVIGISESIGFPSMKDAKGNWTNVSTFEKLTEFKPWEQRDKAKEISKVLNQAVSVVENKPTSGFKLVDVCQNIYAGYTCKFDYWQCVTLRDPRGWNVSVTLKLFQQLLESNNFNIVDHELVGISLMYAWSTAKYGSLPFTLVEANEDAATMQEATEKLLSKSFNAKYIKPSEFEIGKVYYSSHSKAAGHNLMYIGCHDVFSTPLHEDAVKSGAYDIDLFIDMKYDLTARNRHIFYCIDFNKKNIGSYGNVLKQLGCSPYYATSSISKLFEKSKDIACFDAKMYNSSKQVNVDNVLDDMSKSPLFSIVDLKSKTLVDLDYDTFEFIYVRSLSSYGMLSNEAKSAAFPLCLDLRNIVLQVGENAQKNVRFSKFCIVNYGNSFLVTSPATCHYTYLQTVYKDFKFSENSEDSKLSTLKHIYDALQPKVWKYKLANGNEMSMLHSICLNILSSNE